MLVEWLIMSMLLMSNCMPRQRRGRRRARLSSLILLVVLLRGTGGMGV